MHGLSDDERRRVLREQQRQAHPSALAVAATAKEADSKPTILARQLTLRGWDAAKAASKCGISATRLDAIAAGTATPYSFESERLAKTFGLDADLLLAQNTAASRAEVNMKKPLI